MVITVSQHSDGHWYYAKDNVESSVGYRTFYEARQAAQMGVPDSGSESLDLSNVEVPSNEDTQVALLIANAEGTGFLLNYYGPDEDDWQSTELRMHVNPDMNSGTGHIYGYCDASGEATLGVNNSAFLYADANKNCLRLTAPNGTRYEITVTNGGTLSVTQG